MRAVGEPGGEALTRLCRELDRRDPTGVEAKRAGFFA
jgi:hypothetical protein